MTDLRLSKGGAIDRAKPLRFTFDGEVVEAYEGDTVASALIANGIRTVGRSFKYHRPRGIWGYGSEEPNALVDISGPVPSSPNSRATVIPVVDGLVCRSVNSAPSARQDKKSWIDRFSRFIPAAFYYKTFMFPSWHLYEPAIRKMAGLGKIDEAFARTEFSVQKNAHPDILVVGAGPAGLASALAEARAGRSVMLVDEKPEAGGSLLHRDTRSFIDGLPTGRWIAETISELDRLGVRILLSTTAFGIYDHGLVGLNEAGSGEKPDTLWRVRPKCTILATGSIERPLPFANNDLPGIMSADAGLYYLKRQAALAGRKVAIVTNNSSAFEVAAAFSDAGCDVTLIDCRKPARFDMEPTWDYIPGQFVVTANGQNCVTSVTLSDGKTLSCDALLVSGGFTPSIHLFAHAKGKLSWNETLQAFVPGHDHDHLKIVGAARGQFTLGEIDSIAEKSNPGERYSIAATWPTPGAKGRIWIDLQNDVTAKDVELAARENFVSVEHLKRYTTLGMATDQGKTSNMNGLALMSGITGKSIPEVGTTTYRPPFTPVPLTSFAGRRSGILFNPVKRLPLENVHRADGAFFLEYGGWLRPAWFGEGPMEDAVHREVLGARQNVALFDGSTLGKIEVIGPQAAEFLDFIFYNTVSTLKPRRCRYAFILTESGIVYDDGVLVRLDDNRFIVSCSSSHVAGVHSMLEDWRQDRFDRNKVFIHNATAHWATLTVTGPRSRELIAASEIETLLDDENLPHMAIRDGKFRDISVRIARVSFTGDRSYEISVPADRAESLWCHLKDVGQRFSAILLGSEALLVMRAEKGYIITGKDTDGHTRPSDLGLDGPLKNKKVEFLGKRSLLLPDAQNPDRKHFVGLEAVDRNEPLPSGAHGVVMNGKSHRSIGYVTSSYRSPTLQKPIAFGLIERGRERMGEIIDIRHFGEMMRARIVEPCFFDPKGERLHA